MGPLCPFLSKPEPQALCLPPHELSLTPEVVGMSGKWAGKAAWERPGRPWPLGVGGGQGRSPWGLGLRGPGLFHHTFLPQGGGAGAWLWERLAPGKDCSYGHRTGGSPPPHTEVRIISTPEAHRPQSSPWSPLSCNKKTSCLILRERETGSEGHRLEPGPGKVGC